ncbi:MAG TPA: DUF4908 domain-containing protein [Rhizomicrobium sp.]|jgi:hypothetical protein|nr:DUF4908 domain-containing protein [Rhizomicrobium sp.]
MRKGLTVLAVVSALCCAPLLHAQDLLGARLQADAMGSIKPGAYLAGDTIRFLLDKYGSTKFLLRFAGDPEIYVLYADRASLGGRVLKYDTGSTVISIAGWGGMTIYTDSHPEGLPTVRTGDSNTPSLQPVTLGDAQNAESDEEKHLSYAHRYKIAVNAAWNEIAQNADERAQAFDTMQNTIRGLDRFSTWPQGRVALGKIDTVNIVITGGRPTASVNGKTLVVTYNKAQGFAGRASSRAIARALGLLLHVKPPN